MKPADLEPVGSALPGKPSVREAMLRPQFAGMYSGIEPNKWFSAAGLAELLITRLLREGVSGEELPQRVLDPAHFDFRGGGAGSARSSA
jgi:hypothetical protein